MRLERTRHASERAARPRTAVAPAPRVLQSPAAVLALQRSAGNQAVVHALAGTPAAVRTLARNGTTWDKDDETIWVKDPGTRFEESAFPERDDPAANIAGNFPIIDDFTDGVATSLKTIDIVSCYQGPGGLASLRATVSGYITDLAGFSGRTHSGVTVDRKDVKELVLRIAVPPKPAGEVPGYDLRRAIVDELAAKGIDPDNIAINKVAARPRRESTATFVEPSTAKAQKRKRAGDDDEPVKAADTRIRLRAEVKEVPGIWGDVPGRRYEKIAFGGDNPAANIGGNFPTIDDLRGGVATSLKTINIVERHPAPDAVTKLMNGYINTLAEFDGANYPAGPNPKVPPELLSPNKKRILVTADDITSLKLKVAIPPVTAILAAKQAALESSADEEEQAQLEAEIDEITKKHEAVMEFDGQEYEAKSGKTIVVEIEEIA